MLGFTLPGSNWSFACLWRTIHVAVFHSSQTPFDGRRDQDLKGLMNNPPASINLVNITVTKLNAETAKKLQTAKKMFKTSLVGPDPGTC